MKAAIGRMRTNAAVEAGKIAQMKGGTSFKERFLTEMVGKAIAYVGGNEEDVATAQEFLRRPGTYMDLGAGDLLEFAKDGSGTGRYRNAKQGAGPVRQRAAPVAVKNKAPARLTDWSDWSPDKPHGRIPAIKPAAERATRTETMDEWRAAEMQRRRAKATAGGGGDRSRIPYRNAEGWVDPDATEEPNVAVKNKAPARLKVTVDAARDPSAQYDKAKAQHSE